MRPMLAARVGGAAAGAATGAAAGDTPVERLKLGVAGAFVGATAPGAARRLFTPEEQRIANRALGRVVTNTGDLVALYRSRFGKVISADQAKDIISPEYA